MTSMLPQSLDAQARLGRRNRLVRGLASRQRIRVELLFAVVACIVFVPVSVLFLDRPFATFAYGFARHGTPSSTIMSSFKQTPSFFAVIIPALLAILLIKKLVKAPAGKFDLVLVACLLGQAAAEFVVFTTKMLFGRTWPLYHHPSFLRDGVYEFAYWQAGSAYHSFPSGHAASTAALATAVWTYYPSLRPWCIAGFAAIALLLTFGNYHFLSDVAAGGLLGSLVAQRFIIVAERCFARQDPERA